MADVINIPMNVSGWTFNVSMEPRPKQGDGKQKTETKTGRLMWVTQIVGLVPGEGATVMDVTTAGERPSVSVGQLVQPVDMVAMPYLTGGGTGFRGRQIPLELAVSYKASELRSIDTTAPARRSAASS